MPQDVQQFLKDAIPKLEEAMKNFPPEQLEKARKEADKLLSGDLSWADMSQYTPEKIQAIAEVGYSQFELGKYESAEKIFRGLTSLDSQQFYFHQMLGAIFQRQQKFSEAIAEYTIAVSLNPKDVSSWTNRGECFFKSEIYPMATYDFDQAIALDPKEEDPWAGRARMLRGQVQIILKGQKKKETKE